MEKYVCTVCGCEYDPGHGALESGIPSGIPFDALPEDWVCPVCAVGKEFFRQKEQGFGANA